MGKAAIFAHAVSNAFRFYERNALLIVPRRICQLCHLLDWAARVTSLGKLLDGLINTPASLFAMSARNTPIHYY